MCACLVRPALHRSRSDRQPEVIVCFGVPPPDFVRCLTPSAPPQRSNFGGLAFPFLREKLAGRMDCTIRAVEPEACPSLTQGVFEYDFGDTAGLTPLLKVGDPPPPPRPFTAGTWQLENLVRLASWFNARLPCGPRRCTPWALSSSRTPFTPAGEQGSKCAALTGRRGCFSGRALLDISRQT